MLTALRIQNVVIIEKLDIEFKAGLCALTGETGAGKSILLDSLGLTLGKRAESSLVRKGADQAIVSAVFEIEDASHPAYAFLQENALDIEDGAIYLRRALGADGRSKAFINDQPVSAGTLKSLGELLLEIHGQFDTQGLLDPKTHLAMLDEYAGLKQKGLKTVWQALRAAQDEYQRLKSMAENARVEEEYLRGSLEDLDALGPEEGEEEKLSALRERLMNRESVLEALNAAYHALTAEDDPLRAASGVLSRISHKLGEEAERILGPLDRASVEIEEAINAIQSVSSDLEESEYNLETVDERLFALRSQARKHNCSVDELPAIREKLAEDLNAIEHADENLEAAIKAVDKARTEYLRVAKDVSEARKKFAKELDALVAKELPPLKMERARFETQVEPLPEDEWGVNGMDRVRFLVATNPGAEAGPLNKIASGGEMSRFMLALKVVMAAVGSVPSLIFDEVDAGIGGSTADAVGERLARLAAERQVLVVTHSPQVAARANHHYIVSKAGEKNVTTSVEHLPDREARAEEIARMLAGASVTDEARAAAGKLLEASAA